jgi:hypothetical protein
MQTHELQGFSYDDRRVLLSDLTSALTHCGSWVLERKSLSPTTMEFRLEIQLRGIVELYSSLVATGLELTRDTHNTLTALCVSRLHIQRSHRATQVLSIRLELSFLEDVTLHSLLSSGSPSA